MLDFYDLHIHEKIMTLLKIVLCQANANRKNRLGGNSIAFDPSGWRGMTLLMHDET